MCYYARTDYDCHDWKWGNMMLRCPRQHRIGETCGAKLVHSESVTKGGRYCKICEEIQIKKRRYAKTCDNIQRWAREPDKFSASLEKARREARDLSDKIKDLHIRRPSVASSMTMQATKPTANTLPPMSMATTPSTRYETVMPQTNYGSRPENMPISSPRTSARVEKPRTNTMSYYSTSTSLQPRYAVQSHVPPTMATGWDSRTYFMYRR